MNEKLKNLDREFAKNYAKWFKFLNSNIDFTMQDSLLHTLGHCSRVLLFALLLSKLSGLSQKDSDALAMAACFHDSRREDDKLDRGHGRRAAEYYKEYCASHPLAFDERTFYIMAYHDLDDKLGIEAIENAFGDDSKALLLYQIFKDADALDRFRLGPKGLDEKFLRTDAAKELVSFAKTMYELGLDREFDMH